MKAGRWRRNRGGNREQVYREHVPQRSPEHAGHRHRRALRAGPAHVGEVHERRAGSPVAWSPRGSAGHAIAVLAGHRGDRPIAQAVWLAGGSVTMLHQPTPRTDLAVWAEDTITV